jgi:hypothetical protein
LLAIGPPIDPPNWLYSRSCFWPSYLLAESSASFRKNSNTDPANRLLPLLLITVMLPPAPRPLSAGARPEFTRNSAMDSIDVWSLNCEPVALRYPGLASQT